MNPHSQSPRGLKQDVAAKGVKVKATSPASLLASALLMIAIAAGIVGYTVALLIFRYDIERGRQEVRLATDPGHMRFDITRQPEASFGPTITEHGSRVCRIIVADEDSILWGIRACLSRGMSFSEE